jgi:hypothetical protein
VIELRNCRDCDVEFRPRQYNQRRCDDCIDIQNAIRRRGRKRSLDKICKGCGITFRPYSPQQFYCTDECSEENRYLIIKFGITSKDYWTMFEKQSGRCAICNGPGFSMHPTIKRSPLVVDHCHDSGDVRGLLCHNCNRGLGLFQDNQEILQKAIEYLSEERATTIVKTSTPEQVEVQSKGTWKNKKSFDDIV